MPRKKQEIFGVTVEGDISGLQRAMYEAERLFKDAEKSLQNVNKQAKLEPTNVDVITRQFEAYKRAIDEGEKAIRKLEYRREKIIREASKKGVLDQILGSTKLSTIDTDIVRTKDRVKSLKKELNDMGKVYMQVFRGKLTEFYHSLDDNFDAYRRNIAALENIAKQIELNPSNIDLYRQYQEKLNEVILIGTYIQEKYNEELAKIRGEKGYDKRVVELSKEFTDLQKSVALATKEVQKYEGLKMSAEQMKFNKQLELTSNALLDISRSTMYVSRAFRSILTASFDASKQMETDIANIRRVVRDLSDDTVDDLKEIAVQTGTTFTEIAEYASIAGALGIANDQIAEFAQTMTDLNTATGGVFTGEEGAKGIAVFLKQLGLGIDLADNFGSAIAVVGAKYADIGDETINVATKLTGLTSIVKTNQYELLGLAAVMSDLGLSADSNSNAINRAFLVIENIISDTSDKGKEKMKALAQTAGMTSDEFKEAWGKNAMDAFLRFTDGLKSSVFNEINNSIANSTDKVNEYAEALGWSADLFKQKWGEDSQAVFNLYIEALNEMDESGESAASVLKLLGMNTINTAQTMLRLAGSGNDVREAIDVVTEAWNENIALTESAGIIYDTTERKLNGAYESLKQLGGALIGEFAPTIKEMADGLTDFTRSLSQADPNIKKLITYFMAFGAGLSPVARSLGNLGLWFVKNADGVSKFSQSLLGLKTIISGPLGVAAAIGLLGAGIYELDKYSKSQSIFYKMGEDAKELTSTIEEVSRVADESFARMMDGLFEGGEEYASKIDELFATYMDKSLSMEERMNAKGQIQEYIDALNSMLGDEAFAFDYANGQLMFQKEAVESIRDAFAEYQFEVKKQNWLDAHKEELDTATEGMKQMQDDLMEATRTFLEQTRSVPQWVMDILAENQMDVSAVEKAFKEKGIFGTVESENILNTINNALDKYGPVAEKANGAMEKFQEYINKYQEIENSTIDTFDEAVARIEQESTTVNEKLDTTLKTVEALKEEREILASMFGEDSGIVQSYDTEIEQLEKQKLWVDEQLKSWTNIQSELAIIKDGWDSWNPASKEATVVVNFRPNGAPGWMNLNNLNVPMVNSGGYDGAFRSLYNSAINSGGYMSGGTMVFTNNISITGINAVDSSTANMLADVLTDRINENLGRNI